MAKTSFTSVGNSTASLTVDSLAVLAHTRAGARLLHRPHQRKGIHMHVTLVRTAVPMLLVLTLGALCFAGEQSRPQAPSAPTIDGTYKLSSRKLPDGTVLKPPDIIGLQRIRRAIGTLTFSTRMLRANTIHCPSYRPTRSRPRSTPRLPSSASASVGRRSAMTSQGRPSGLR
jgi:hypothetical protein